MDDHPGDGVVAPGPAGAGMPPELRLLLCLLPVSTAAILVISLARNRYHLITYSSTAALAAVAVASALAVALVSRRGWMPGRGVWFVLTIVAATGLTVGGIVAGLAARSMVVLAIAVVGSAPLAIAGAAGFGVALSRSRPVATGTRPAVAARRMLVAVSVGLTVLLVGLLVAGAALGQDTADRYKVVLGGPAYREVGDSDASALRQAVGDASGADIVSVLDPVNDERYTSVLKIGSASAHIDIRIGNYVDEQVARRDYTSSTVQIMERSAAIVREPAPVPGATAFASSDRTLYVSFLRGKVRVAMSFGTPSYDLDLSTRIARAIDSYLASRP